MAGVCGVHRHVEVFERGTCGCLLAVKQEVRAKQVVQEIFGASTSHPIGHECQAFVQALTRTSHATRSTKLSPTKANAIMTTIARKMGAFKRHMLEDAKLQARLAQIQAQEQSEHDYDEFLDQIRHMGPGGRSSLTSVEQFVPTLTTDEFIPIHLFVVMTSNALNLPQTRSYLKLMCDPRDTIGEIGYYFTIFEGVIDLVQQHRNLHEPILR